MQISDLSRMAEQYNMVKFKAPKKNTIYNPPLLIFSELWDWKVGNVHEIREYKPRSPYPWITVDGGGMCSYNYTVWVMTPKETESEQQISNFELYQWSALGRILITYDGMSSRDVVDRHTHWAPSKMNDPIDVDIMVFPVYSPSVGWVKPSHEIRLKHP